MAVRHISGSGSDSNDGVSKSRAWRTMQYALSQMTEDSTIIVHRGVYEGKWGTMPAYNLNIFAVAENLFDLAGGTPWFAGPGSAKAYRMWGLDVWNFGGGDTGFLTTGNTITLSAWNCIIGQKGVYYQSGPTGASLINNGTSLFYLLGCSLFGWARFGSAAANVFASDCIFSKFLTTAYYATVRYCSGDPAFAYTADGTGCFSGVTYPAPFVSVNSATPDLRFDSGATNYNKFLTEGEFGRPIGAMRGLGSAGANRLQSQMYWVFEQNNKVPLFDMDQTGHLGAWANNEKFFDTTFQSVTITTGVNDKIDFSDGSTKVATLAAGTYTSGAALATEVQTRLNAASSGFTVTYLTTSCRLQMTKASGTFSLLWNTGANKATSACADLGYVDTADLTGSLSYIGDNYLLVGSATATDAPAVWDDTLRAWKINTTIVPSGTDAEVVTPVVDGHATRDFKYLFAQEDLEGTGAITYKYRGDADSFGQQDAAGTTDVDWTSCTEGTEVTSSNSFRYTQGLAHLAI